MGVHHRVTVHNYYSFAWLYKPLLGTKWTISVILGICGNEKATLSSCMASITTVIMQDPFLARIG